MTKRKRSDYQSFPEITFEGFKIQVLGDLHSILEVQGPLAQASAYHHNRQNYGPFRVTVTRTEEPKKEKRAKKKQ